MVLWHPFYCQGYRSFFPGWALPTPSLHDVLSSLKCSWYFLFLFLPHLFLWLCLLFLNLNSSFPFYSSLSLAEILLFCFMDSIKTFPDFPPHSWLWSLLHLNLMCFAVPLVALNTFSLALWSSHPLWDCELLKGKYIMLKKSWLNNC